MTRISNIIKNSFSSSSSSSSSSTSNSHSNSSSSNWLMDQFNQKWYVDDDIQVFKKALQSTDHNLPSTNAEINLNNNSKNSLNSNLDLIPNPPLPSSATSNSHQQAFNHSPKRKLDIVREGWAYHISRWPILAIIGLAFIFEFLIYVLVRQIVKLFESLVSWSGTQARLRRNLKFAQNYQQWKSYALQLDQLFGFDHWKKNPSNAYYDSSLVKKVVESLKKSRRSDDVEGIRAVLEVCLRANFAGVESLRLYSQTFLGTKTLIEDYIDEVEKSITYLSQSNQMTPEDKTIFFRRAAIHFGTSALCLSGGATFGFYHFGVVRALLDAKLLPTVISGTSAGALVAAFVCTHTDEELDQLLVPDLADMISGCEEPITVWLPRLIKTGARFDTVAWAKKSSFFTMGSLTFSEAFKRTGRILNVSVIPHDIHSPTTLLNHITAPNCVIFSAVLASAAVPLVMHPVVLLEKTKDGKVRPWQFQGKHKDGSLRVDVPLESLHSYFNTSFSIVSQVNPHIHLFFFGPRGSPGQPVVHRKGKGWRGGFFLSAMEQYLKIELTKNLRVIRDLELLPESGGQTWTAVFLQRFEGSVTIFPESRFRDWFNILSDPDRNELGRMIDVGKRVTWPKIRMIENRLRIERKIMKGREETKKVQEPMIPKPHVVQGLSKSKLANVSKRRRFSEGGLEAIGSGSDLELDPKQAPMTECIGRKARMRRDRSMWNKRFSASMPLDPFINLPNDEMGLSNDEKNLQRLPRLINP
ncbi:hypothetical protein O181_031373 [Austropuccinia psidii MF-1]|uniref:Patatin-like phospholipase domain-containing protein n=1 Tax=Austropuccinia psidii MF-1 TaxID=1389203 RepID=A0A9Q3CXC0_9BASI|nr:hypothetical protein [Austropuccinia psidii MF-1]